MRGARQARRVVVAIAVLAASGVPASRAVAQEGRAEVLPVGRLVERMPAAGDPSRSFALYVPSAYTPSRRWPLVVLLDPRGRGAGVLRRLVPVAERLGYVLAGSYDTASDVSGDPNTPAVNAILATLQPRLSLDTRRFYLFGMSGTARAAWALGYAAMPHVAGVAGFGAGTPPDMDLEAVHRQFGAPFVFYGGAGEGDFNHAELVELEERLRELDIPHTIAFYAGPHGWPGDDDELEAALRWMHWMAMKRGLAAPDSAWLRAEYERRLAAADSLAAAGRSGPAWRAYRRLAADADDFLAYPEAERHAAALEGRPEVAAWRTRRLELAREHAAYKARISRWLEATRTGRLLRLDRALRELAVDSLRTLAEESDDRMQAAAAGRALADLFSLTSFYYPRFYAGRAEWGRARLTLEIADAIRPGSPAVRRQLAQVRTELGADGMRR